MRGPAVDVVLLLLLVLFFGLQQRRRPELHYRFWFVGWIFVSLSVLAWEMPFVRSAEIRVQDVIRLDLLLAGTITFGMSFMVTRERLRETLLAGVGYGLPAMLAIDSNRLLHAPYWVLATLLAVAHGCGFVEMRALMPKDHPRRTIAVGAINALFGAGLLLALYRDRGTDLADVLLAEVLLAVAVLYGGMYARKSYVGIVGAVGFLAWGLFYLVPFVLPGLSEAMKLFYVYWNVPKDFVGFAMIVQIFEDSRTEAAQIADEYRVLYEDFRLIFEGHPHAMWIYDPETEMILSANMAASAAYGYSRRELLEMRVADLEIPCDAETEMVDQIVAQPPDGRRTRHRHKDGHAIWVNAIDHATSYKGREARLGMARDITERLKMNRELERRAHHDVLTGLPNRMLLADRMARCLARCEQEGRKAVLLTIDVDHFKLVNDTYGHLIGDECLKLVAARLASKIRQIDTIARVGGEEFAAIIGGIRCAEDAEKIAASLLRQFEEPLELPGMELGLTVSIGGAVYPDHGNDSATLREQSDRALYAAKRGGRNRAAFAVGQESRAGR
jgi:diguanylate cyclase (GGDEF)-like protein/PAS domain S-box-containing protein